MGRGANIDYKTFSCNLSATNAVYKLNEGKNCKIVLDCTVVTTITQNAAPVSQWEGKTKKVE